MTIPFVGGSYTLNVRKADDQRSINLMPVHNEVPGGKSVAYLDSVAGLKAFSVDSEVTGFLLLENGSYLLLEGGGRIILE